MDSTTSRCITSTEARKFQHGCGVIYDGGLSLKLGFGVGMVMDLRPLLDDIQGSRSWGAWNLSARPTGHNPSFSTV